jgi:hypothetical protein
MAIRIGEGSPKDPFPSDGHVLLIDARHLFRLIAERENRLRRGSTSQCETVPLHLHANPTNRRLRRSSLPGHDGHSSPQAIGHRTSNSTIYNLLARHGWRKLMPRPFHPLRNIAAQNAFKKTAFQVL